MMVPVWRQGAGVVSAEPGETRRNRPRLRRVIVTGDAAQAGGGAGDADTDADAEAACG